MEDFREAAESWFWNGNESDRVYIIPIVNQTCYVCHIMPATGVIRMRRFADMSIKVEFLPSLKTGEANDRVIHWGCHSCFVRIAKALEGKCRPCFALPFAMLLKPLDDIIDAYLKPLDLHESYARNARDMRRRK